MMELRFRGKKSAEDANSIVFWLCDGPKKRRVLGNKSQSLTSAASEWELESELEDVDLHFMNESTGLVVPRDEAMGKHISDRDVLRLCSTEELGTLLEKFATRDQEVAAEMMNPQKAGTSIGAALSRLKKMSATNPTLKKIQKTLEEHTSPHAAKVGDVNLLDRFVEADPIFELGDIEEVTGDAENLPQRCDMCEVSWPDDGTCSMYRWTKLGIITHQGCVQFTADVLAKYPEITSRDEFLAKSSVTANLNKPGTFYVTVHRAMELPGTQLIGKPAPYAKLSLLPWKEPLQTKPVENGGRNPVWDSVRENEMQFSHMYNSTITPIPLLEVEVYNYNYIADDQVACTLLDMSPLLRFPNIEVKRWFTLSSRALLTQSTGQPRVMLGIKFVATEGEIKAANKHKFRVHQLKSIGLAIPNCAVCDRSIMNALKSVWGYRADPMYMEKVCFKARRPNSTFHIEVIDFNSDQCIARLDVTLFQLLQREADRFVHKEHYKLSSPQVSKPQPDEKFGFVLIDLEYVEHKEDLLRIRLQNDFSLLEREEKEFSVESLRITFDRLNRALKIFQGIDAQYASVISWKNKKKSAVCFVAFVYACVFADFEYALSYVFGGILVYMLYRLHLRVEGSFVARWIGYEDYELEQEEQQQLYRPLANLHIAVHEALLSTETDSLLMESQSRLKDVSSSKLGFYVRIKYRPNDKRSEGKKEKSKIIGANLLDTFWKVKDTIKQLQNEIGRACGALACAENLLNWTHPWKTATAFAVVAMLTLVFSVVRGRWAILFFGVTEFGAVFVDDAPASKRARKILGNYLSSLPTDQDLIELYDPERAVYLKQREAMREEDEELAVRLRHHALWTGTISSKAAGDRYSKNYFVVYQPYRFLLWKNEDDAEEGAQAHFQLLFEKPEAVTDKADEKMDGFKVSGVSSSGIEGENMSIL
ncbi:hypothetical protein BBO99_00007614 [Phytophthora kernoviae]|uniref:C2 domain-containing protein n=2 Tax=Phytophthora kernoviae TaxID=325452 RepID=A0A3R7G5K5_9STRA|nr:hypothetical protein G195_008668 [Phytophthora kernoviae 00238/432]KAG2517152.1 hypothetical protein JM16_007516 [Phytophthora kernoviae]KAG2519727.1 hypothetical protein JM18_007207 [Phytophthora kernoviae]RLN31412.1 hypothetical protein BBI17_007520 [Phytophthora kernoviae]RLN76355.1 hypothetical protein BBO99_00007614 [Phytophthora kernoviae]